MNSFGRYLELRGELARRGESFKTMAITIGRSYLYVIKCIAGESNFRIDEAYAALDWMGIPHAELNRVFPKNGIA